MAGKFEITKAGDGTFSFEFLIDGTPVAQSPVFEKEDACRRGVKAVKKNSRMKVQNAFAGDEEKTNPKYLVEPAENGARFTLFLQTGEPCLTGMAIMPTPRRWPWQRWYSARMNCARSA